MNFSLVACIVLVVLLVWWYFPSSKRRSGKKKDVVGYFQHAVLVYGVVQDYGAKLAALALAQTVTPSVRDVLMIHLDSQMKSWDAHAQQVPEARPFHARLEDLTQAMGSRQWTSHEAIQAKEELEMFNPDYLQALNAGDSSVFVQKYPTLFRSSNLDDLMTEGRQLLQTAIQGSVQKLEGLKRLKGLDVEKRKHLESIQRELKTYLRDSRIP